MKQFHSKELVDFAVKILNEKWGYVWGGRGKNYNNSEASYLYSRYATSKYDKTYYFNTQMKRWKGHKVADCSGLIEAFRGEDATADMLYHGCNKSGTIKNFDDTPGTLLFIDSAGRKVHVGIAVGNGYVIHSKNSAIGVVREKIIDYNWTHYGVPTWLILDKDVSTLNHFEWVKKIQKEFGVKQDGIVGTNTLLHSKTVEKGTKGALVKLVQEKLIAEGYSVGKTGADGIFGQNTKDAVINYQNANTCVPDGIITAQAKTWRKLLNYKI